MTNTSSYKPETPRDWTSLADFLEGVVSIQPDFDAMTPEEYDLARRGMLESLHTVFALRDTPRTPGDEGAMKNPLFNSIDSETWLSGEALRAVHTLLYEAWLPIFGRAPGDRADFEGGKKKLKAAFRNCELALVVMRLRLALPPEALRANDPVVVEIAGRARRVLLGDEPH